MKKEIIYIAVPLILCLGGFFYKSFFLSDTIEETQKIINISDDLSAKFFKDSLVQHNVKNIKKLYENNKREDKNKVSYGEVIADLIKDVETMLQKAGIEYQGNDINQELDEVTDFKSGTSCFYINLSLSTSYGKIRNLIQEIEQSEQVINIVSIEMFRGKPESDSKAGAGAAKDEDEYNVNVPVNLKARLEFVKYL
ncbi:MAG TPA: hypothetical protein PLK90_02470 [Clostridiales bacterium]|jgi:hypothetical protein|nr:hypothetical protein [Clostridiales bacterium]HQP69242.1 hypothetical protein [Clostridiales bacterium]